MNTNHAGESNPFKAPESLEPNKSSKSGWYKLGVFAFVAIVAAVLYTQFGSYLSLESLAKQETALRDYQAQHPVLVFAIAFLIYVAVTGLSLPGATVLTLVFGWYFGFLECLVLVLSLIHI